METRPFRLANDVCTRVYIQILGSFRMFFGNHIGFVNSGGTARVTFGAGRNPTVISSRPSGDRRGHFWSRAHNRWIPCEEAADAWMQSSFARLDAGELSASDIHRIKRECRNVRTLHIRADRVNIGLREHEHPELHMGESDVSVEGNPRSVQTVSGALTVNGQAGSVKSTSGSITVSGGCTGDASSVSGNLTIHGRYNGNASSVSGRVVYQRPPPYERARSPETRASGGDGGNASASRTYGPRSQPRNQTHNRRGSSHREGRNAPRPRPRPRTPPVSRDYSPELREARRTTSRERGRRFGDGLWRSFDNIRQGDPSHEVVSGAIARMVGEAAGILPDQ